MFGSLPAFGLYLRHVAQFELHHVCFHTESTTDLPAISGDDFDSLSIALLATREEYSAWLHALRNSFVEIVALGKSEKILLRFSGTSTADVVCRVSGGSHAKSQIILDPDLATGSVEII